MMAGYKNITSVYDYSKNTERQAFWMAAMGFMRAGLGGYIVSEGLAYDYRQVIDTETGLIKENPEISINNMELGFLQGSDFYGARLYDENTNIGSNLLTDNKDVVLLIETEKFSETNILPDYAHEINKEDLYYYNPLKTHTKSEAKNLYGDYIKIKNITLYAGVNNNRTAILATNNRLCLFIRELMINETYKRVSNLFTNYTELKGKTACMSMDIQRFLSYPFILQFLRLFNINVFNNNNDGVIGLVYNNSMSKATNLIESDYYDIIFKSDDTLKLFLNYFNIPYTFSQYNAQNVKVEDLDDGYKPYNPDPTPGGSSKPDGGKGNFDDTSDTIYIPETPTTTAIRTDFITVWNPTVEEIQQLSERFWTDNLITQGINKFLSVGIDAIVGLYTIPFAPQTSELKHSIYFGNVDSDVDAYQVVNQFAEFDCGSLKIEEYWGNALDYSPYTKIELFLPFIGMVTLNPDDVMNKTVGIKYKCDVVSGACIAFISVNDSVLYTYQGNCITNIPVTSQNFSQMTSALITAGVNVAGAVATGGATALASAGLMSATSVLTTKAPIQHSGSLTGSSGMMGVRTPYFVITRPVQSIPKNYNNYRGYPSNITATLSELSGYTEVEYIHLEGFTTATSTELEQIEQLLKEGVII